MTKYPSLLSLFFHLPCLSVQPPKCPVVWALDVNGVGNACPGCVLRPFFATNTPQVCHYHSVSLPLTLRKSATNRQPMGNMVGISVSELLTSIQMLCASKCHSKFCKSLAFVFKIGAYFTEYGDFFVTLHAQK